MDLFQLVAKLSLDSTEYEKGISNAKGKLSGLGSGIKKGAAAVAAASVAGVTAATTAVGALTKASLDGYANYEQMVGGVQKLYGNMGMSLEDYAKSVGKSTSEIQTEWQNLEAAQDIVLKNAKNAYKTAGMSANQYMEIATSFSASLINSLAGDTKKAAAQTDVAMKAISDNWNTFGGDISMVQNAFMGFAKQNYTMLDNLKLGYGGTKNEMQRLIEDANTYAASIGQASNLSIKSFSDIVTAIDLIQQKQHIAGTTAREASTTIEGSINAVKAAWDNLVTGFADPDADISELMKNVATTGITAVGNLIPAFSRALEGIGSAISDAAPKIIESIPKAFDTIGVPLIKTGEKLIQGIFKGMQNAIPKLFNEMPKLFSALPDFLERSFLTAGNTLDSLTKAGGELLGKLGDGMIKGLPQFFENVLPLIEQFTANLRKNAGKIVDAGLDLLVKFAQGFANSLPVLIEHVPQIIINIANIINDNAPKIIVAGVKIIGYLIIGIIKAIPTLIANLPKIIEAIFAVWSAVNWTNLGKKAINLIKNGFTMLKNELPNALKSIGEKAINFFRYVNWQNAGQGAIKLIVTGIKAVGKLVWMALRSIGKTSIQIIKNINWMSVGKAIVTGIAKGITAVPGIIANALLSVTKLGYNKVTKYLRTGSPSKLFREKVGITIPQGMALGVKDGIPEISKAMDDVNSKLSLASVEPFSISTKDSYIPDTADGVLGAMESLQVQDIGSEESYRNVTVVLELNRTELGRTIFNLYNDEEQRHGVKLAGGYA